MINCYLQTKKNRIKCVPAERSRDPPSLSVGYKSITKTHIIYKKKSKSAIIIPLPIRIGFESARVPNKNQKTHFIQIEIYAYHMYPKKISTLISMWRHPPKFIAQP